MKKYYFYLDIDNLKINKNYAYEITEVPIKNYKEKYPNAFEFYSNKVFNVPIFNENTNSIKEATIEELIDLGYISLDNTQYLENNQIKSIYDIPCSPNIIKRKWDNNTKQWIEGATLEEQIDYLFNEIVYTKGRINTIHTLGLETFSLEKDLEILMQKHSLLCQEYSLKEDLL